MENFAFKRLDILSRNQFNGFTPKMNLGRIMEFDFNQFSHSIDHVDFKNLINLDTLKL